MLTGPAVPLGKGLARGTTAEDLTRKMGRERCSGCSILKSGLIIPAVEIFRSVFDDGALTGHFGLCRICMVYAVILLIAATAAEFRVFWCYSALIASDME
jgi:hypothetical protein